MKTVNDVLRGKGQLESYYREMKDNFKESLEFYNGDFSVLNTEARDKFHEVLPLTARSTVDTVASHFVPDDFKVTCEPLKETEAARKQANGIEELCLHMLRRIDNSGLSPFSQALKDCMIYGVGCLRDLYDVTIWDERPERADGESQEDYEYREALWGMAKRQKFPYVITTHDPQNLLWSPGTDQPEFMYECGKLLNWNIKQSFPDYEYAANQEFRGTNFFGFWDKETKMYVANRQPVNTNFNNPFGHVPYSLVWSGLGKNDPDGKPEGMASGLIHPLIPALKEQARSYTSLSILLQVWALGRGWTRGFLPEKNMAVMPGQFVDLQEGQDVGFFPAPPVSPELYNMINIASQEIDEYVGAKVLGGQKIPGIGSALGYELLREESKKKYRGFVKSFEAALSRMCGHWLDIVERHIKEQIPGTGIKPHEIRGYHVVQVELIHKDVAKERMTAAMTRMLYQAGLIDFDEAHSGRYLGSSNPDKIREGKLVDRVLESPDVIKGLVIKQLESMNVRELVDAAEERRAKASAIELSSEVGQVGVRSEEDMFNKMMFGEDRPGALPGIEQVE